MGLLNAKELAREDLAREIEVQLTSEYSNMFRRIFIQYTFHPKNGFVLVLTLFPADGGPYEIVSRKSQQLNYESASKILQNHINE